MSILDDEDKLVNQLENESVIFITGQNDQYRCAPGCEMPVTRGDYKELLDAYHIVSESYIKFFKENFYRDNLQKTNDEMIARLVEKGLAHSGIVFASVEDCNAVGQYVLTLPMPATIVEMREFRDRVLTGDLEWRCRYPIKDTCALEIFRHIHI